MANHQQSPYQHNQFGQNSSNQGRPGNQNFSQHPGGADPNAQHRSDQFQYPKPKSGMAIVGLVLGVIALLISFLPIINNLAFILGLLGLIFAIVGLVGTARGKKSGKGIAIAALIITILSCIIVLATQSMYSAAIDEASASLENPAVSSTENSSNATDTTSSDNSAAAESEYTDMALGTSVDFSNGLTVSVDSYETGIENYDGSSLTAASVTYVNNGDSEASFNVFDWEGQDSSGVLTSATIYGNSDDELNSGNLVPGGSITGTVYFSGDIEKVLYNASVFSDATYSWVLS